MQPLPRLHIDICLKLLLVIGVGFYLFEFFLHFFGLPILEHNKIFLPTHDRYIGLYGLTYAALFAMIITNIAKYRMLFVMTMIGVLLGMINAYIVAESQAYTTQFDAAQLDRDLSLIGWTAGVWYVTTWMLWVLQRRHTLLAHIHPLT